MLCPGSELGDVVMNMVMVMSMAILMSIIMMGIGTCDYIVTPSERQVLFLGGVVSEVWMVWTCDRYS